MPDPLALDCFTADDASCRAHPFLCLIRTPYLARYLVSLPAAMLCGKGKISPPPNGLPLITHDDAGSPKSSVMSLGFRPRTSRTSFDFASALPNLRSGTHANPFEPRQPVGCRIKLGGYYRHCPHYQLLPREAVSGWLASYYLTIDIGRLRIIRFPVQL